MREYALIMLHMLEYACIYLDKQSSKYARILNVSIAVCSISSLYKLLSSYRDRDAFRTLSNIYDRAKRIMPECMHATKYFSEQGRFRGARALR